MVNKPADQSNPTCARCGKNSVPEHGQICGQCTQKVSEVIKRNPNANE